MRGVATRLGAGCFYFGGRGISIARFVGGVLFISSSSTRYNFHVHWTPVYCGQVETWALACRVRVYYSTLSSVYCNTIWQP